VWLVGGMNGRQLADAGRTLRSNLRVLFITGCVEHSIVDNEGLKPGERVLHKPFSIEILATQIKDMIAYRP
jgi:DNA-binding response OmpR family regulator